MKKSTPFMPPANLQPVIPVPRLSARDPNFYEDQSGEASREEPIEPMDQPLERGLPAPRATTSGMPYKLDGGRR